MVRDMIAVVTDAYILVQALVSSFSNFNFFFSIGLIVALILSQNTFVCEGDN